MNLALKTMLPRIENWPDADQRALADYAREMEAERTGFYVMDDEERAAVAEGLAQADAGDFAAESEIEAIRKRCTAA